MTIAFKCPKCERLCAFADKHAGKRARCTTCQQLFIIPSKTGGKVEKVKEDRGEPLAGFYRAVLNCWKIFVKPSSVTGLVFVAAAVTFKFFLRDADYSFPAPGGYVVHLPVGWIVTITAWGCLCWYYMETIRWTVFGQDDLPEVDMGAGLEFLWNVLKCVYLFIVALIVAELPFLIIISILRKTGLEWPPLFHALILAGLLSFPMVILTLTTAPQLWMVFRPDYIWTPIVKAFKPYLATTALFLLAVILQWLTVNYSLLQGKSRIVVVLHFAANIAVQAIAIAAMRTIGLFYRHYGCYLAWLDQLDD
jgi:hypothetical protein